MALLINVSLPWTAQFIFLLALAARLFASSLYRTYRWFCAYVVFEILRNIASVFIPNGTIAYGYMYLSTQPVFLFLQAAVVFEVIRLAVRNHPGIATLGRKLLLWALVLSTGGSLVTLLGGVQTNSPYRLLEYVFTLERLINSSLFGVVLIFLLFLAYFPVPLTRNALIHAGLFGAYFISKTLLLLVRNMMGPEITNTINTGITLLSACLLFAWAFLLRASGEQQPVRSSRRRDAAEEERLIAQLDSINSTLLESAKKL
jgi:hypothetical protein